MDKTLFKEVKYLINTERIKPSKLRGQNFLINKDIINQICTSLPIHKTNNILEIGPGLGALTSWLSKTNKNIFAFEIDKKFIDVLKTKFKNNLNLKIINQDFLKLDLDTFLSENKIKDYFLIGNLPYSITSQIFLKIISLDCPPKKAVFMIQKEFAERILAPVNHKKYNAFSIIIQWFSSSKVLFDVPPESFIPKPKITSSVIIMEFKNQKSFQKKKPFFKFVKLLFLNRRKTILNNLGAYLNDKSEAKKILDECKINKELRPQNLSLKDWEKLYDQVVS